MKMNNEIKKRENFMYQIWMIIIDDSFLGTFINGQIIHAL